MTRRTTLDARQLIWVPPPGGALRQFIDALRRGDPSAAPHEYKETASHVLANREIRYLAVPAKVVLKEPGETLRPSRIIKRVDLPDGREVLLMPAHPWAPAEEAAVHGKRMASTWFQVCCSGPAQLVIVEDDTCSAAYLRRARDPRNLYEALRTLFGKVVNTLLSGRESFNACGPWAVRVGVGVDPLVALRRYETLWSGLPKLRGRRMVIEGAGMPEGGVAVEAEEIIVFGPSPLGLAPHAIVALNPSMRGRTFHGLYRIHLFSARGVTYLNFTVDGDAIRVTVKQGNPPLLVVDVLG